MTKTKLLEAFEAGDMSDVEFVELALATDMTMDEIEAALAAQLEEAL